MSKELLKVLLDVQKELPVVGKTTQAYNYKYAPIDQVWEHVKPVLQKHGFVITNEISTDGVKTIAHHELGELTSSIPFSNINLEPQKKGSEITYARRYNLTAIFNIIVAGEDDDASSTKQTEYDPTDDFGKATCKIHGDVLQEAISKKTNKPYLFHKMPSGDMCFGH